MGQSRMPGSCTSTALAALLALVGCGSGEEGESPSATEPAVTATAEPPTATPIPPSPTSPPCSDDQDADGFIRVGCQGGTDCNDLNAAINPSAPEGIDTNGDSVLDGDGIDNNCDGQIDEGTGSYDDDGDGYCEGPACTDGATAGDCNDVAPGIAPGQPELCDTVDNDCSGVADDLDEDNDGFIAAACSGNDCDDLDPDINPQAPEGTDNNGDGVLEGDNLDNDCDLAIDEGTSLVDDDGDGFSDAAGDCDDSDPLVFPGAIERFDGKDQNCDGVFTAGTTAAAAPASLYGDQADAKAGFSLAGGGDVDGDGYDDLVIGAPLYDVTNSNGGTNINTGMAFLVPGRDLGWNVGTSVSTTAHFILPDAPGSRVGWAVTVTGDISGDGRDDFAIGAPGFVVTSSENAGAVFIVAGQSAPFGDTTLGDHVDSGGATSYGLSANVEFGYALAGGKDVTGDGIPDLLIGYPWDVSNPPARAQGYVSIYSGRYSGLEPEIKASDLSSLSGAQNEAIGFDVVAVGDIDKVAEPGGTYPAELLFAAKGDSQRSGKVYLVPGNDTYGAPGPKVLAQTPSVSWSGDAGNEMVGMSVADLGDVNGDASVDIGFARDASTPAEAIAYIVPTGGLLPTGGNAESTAGTVRVTGTDTDVCPCKIAGVGDFNADGFSDFVVSAANAGGSGIPSTAGRIYVFLGSATLVTASTATLDATAANFSFTGEAQGDQFGGAVEAAGDLNGDGFSDFVVGAPGADVNGAADAGKVYVFFGFGS